MAIVEMVTKIGSVIGGLLLAWAMFQRNFPHQLEDYIHRYSRKLVSMVDPYLRITIDELMTGEYRWMIGRCEAYTAIQNYLSANSSGNARRIRAHFVRNSLSPVFSIDEYEEVTDEFDGVKVWWTSITNLPRTQTISLYAGEEERKSYRLSFHKRYREIVTGPYLDHVLKEGKAIEVRNRQRKLFTNNPSKDPSPFRTRTKWSHLVFEHPATFDTLAMATKKKEEIKKDLIKFSKGKEYYAKIGKAWKRGYLLYGPPGTGKSTMIAAMANFLDYDVYDIELTTIKDNSELRSLLIDTTAKSIIVIEDIDCSLHLTGQRKETKHGDKEEKKKDPMSEMKKELEEESKNSSKVTLSGILNAIDGIWSACGTERIIVFTTNYVDKLDPALIRRGRMDKRINMSYCCFEAFKELAKIYLDIGWHELFPKIEQLLEETNMSPADVAENLMPKSDDQDEETCLKKLIEDLEASKEEDRKKAEEEARKKFDEEGAKKGVEPGEKVKEKGDVASSDAEVKNGVVTEG